MELNNDAFFRLGNMLYFEIQKRKEVIKASDFWQNIGGTAAYMKRNMKDTEGCGQISYNDTLFDDNWFNIVKTEDEANAEVVEYCGPVKTIHKRFSQINWKINEIMSERGLSC